MFMLGELQKGPDLPYRTGFDPFTNNKCSACVILQWRYLSTSFQ